tara:strand:- start:917 stop:1498 length:582 start_codon:yes stop_codon:yes gene_type:complete
MNNEEWTSDQETVLEKIRENALQRNRIYKRLYLSYKGQLARYKIPIIVLSAFNSVFSVGAEKYLPQHIISGVSCLISLFVGIIGSIQMYLQIEANMESSLSSSRDYYNLAIDIYKVLTLKRDHRLIDGKTYLDKVYNDYVTMTEKSLINRRKYLDGLFTTPDLPDNGDLRLTIQPQSIHSYDPDTTSNSSGDI